MTLLVVGLAFGAVAGDAHAVQPSHIVTLKDDADPAAVAARDGVRPQQVWTSALHGYAATLDAKQLAAVRADSATVSVEPNRTIALEPSPQTQPVPQPAQVPANAVRRIGATVSSTASGDGHGRVHINVAVLDGGIDSRHPDLNVAGGHSCLPDDPSFDNDPEGHGTLVAGLIGALDNQIGRVGVAPGARLFAVRVFDHNDVGTAAELICGVDWVTSTRLDSDRSNDIAVANISVGDNGTKAKYGNESDDSIWKPIASRK